VLFNSEVEQCQQEDYVRNVMARGPFHVLPAVALVAGASRVSSSVSADSAMEAADVAVMSAAVQQKLNRTRFDDLSDTPPDDALDSAPG
jgi:hypothetical protein